MKKIILLLLLLPLVSYAQNENDTNKKKLEHFIALADSLRIKTNVPGVGMAIVADHEIIYTGGIGYINLKDQTPVTENSLFVIGSITKSFTAALAAQLVADNQMKWNDKIIQHLPDFKLGNEYVTQNVTIQDAFTHMTGLGRHDSIWKNNPKITQKEIYERLQTLSFTHSLRAQWSYNNLMYMVLGMLVERVGKKSWHNLIADHLFKPLGMTKSFTNYEDFMRFPERATGYNYTSLHTRPHVNVDAIAGAGSITSTPKDMSKWLSLFVNQGVYKDKVIINQKEYDHMTRPPGNMSLKNDCTIEYYSVPWSGRIQNGKRHIAVSGAIDGANAIILLKPEDGFGIFICVNNDFHEYKRLLERYAVNIFVNNDYTRDYEEENRLRLTMDTNILFDKLIQTFQNDSEAVALNTYKTLKNDYKEVFSEQLLNTIAYQLFIPKKDYAKAISVLELNAKEFPKSSNVYDSLGEIYVLDKQFKKALKNYKKSVALNPNNDNAKNKIKEIEEKLQKN